MKPTNQKRAAQVTLWLTLLLTLGWLFFDAATLWQLWPLLDDTTVGHWSWTHHDRSHFALLIGLALTPFLLCVLADWLDRNWRSRLGRVVLGVTSLHFLLLLANLVLLTKLKYHW